MGAPASRRSLVLFSLVLLQFFAAFALAQSRDGVFGGILGKRDTNTTVIPAPINVEASQYWDGNDGPWSSFPLQVGTQPQDVRVMVSTAGFDVWAVQDKGCPNGTIAGCSDSRGFLFLYNESNTYVQNSIFDVALEDNLGMDITANFGFDTVTLGWQGSGGPTVQHTVIASIADYSYWLGIFGLNPRPTNFTTFNDPQPSFMSSLKNNSSIPSLSWAYTAGNQYRFQKVFGSLVLGGYDQSRFTPTNVSFPFYEDVGRELLVSVSSIKTDTTTLSSTAFSAYIDSTIPYLYLPLSVCQAFESAFGLTYNSTYDLYLVNSTLHTSLLAFGANVTFTLSAPNGTVDITLPYSAFDLTATWPLVSDQSFYFPLKRASNDTQYTLGRTFLQEAYLIADYERSNFTVAPCAWNENAQADIKTILSPNSTAVAGNNSSSSGLGAGAIAGVVVGIVALIAVLAVLLFFFRRRKRTQRRRVAELEAREAKTGDADGSSGGADGDTSNKPFIQLDHELGGGEIHELHAPSKPVGTHEMDSPHKLDPNRAGYNELEGDGRDVVEYFGKAGTAPGGRAEMVGDTPIYEMQGSEMQELDGREGQRKSE